MADLVNQLIILYLLLNLLEMSVHQLNYSLGYGIDFEYIEFKDMSFTKKVLYVVFFPVQIIFKAYFMTGYKEAKRKMKENYNCKRKKIKISLE